MKYTVTGFLLGCFVAVLAWLSERTTGDIDWGMVLSFPLFWSIAGYLFWRWDLFGWRESE